MVLVKLLEQERKFFLQNNDPATFISFYETSATAYENVENQIKLRFREILEKNPWLCGRLVSANNTEGEKEVYLSYNSDENIDISAYLDLVVDDTLLQLTEWRSILDHAGCWMPKVGISCVDNDETLCRLVVFRNTCSDKFAIMFAVNHTIGDGYTFYYLWKMLDLKEPVRGMEVQRVHSHTLPNVLLHHKLGMSEFHVKTEQVRRDKKLPKILIFKVSDKGLRKLKDENNTDDFFVSTNDILCSQIFGACKSSNVVNLNVNMRLLIPGVNANMAGNYIGVCPVNCRSTPRQFRMNWVQLLSGEKKGEGVSSPNWTTSVGKLYRQVDFEGCQHLFHVPVWRNPDMFVLAGETECCMTLFRLDKRNVGVVIGVDENIFNVAFFDKCDFLEPWPAMPERMSKL